MIHISGMAIMRGASSRAGAIAERSGVPTGSRPVNLKRFWYGCR